MSKRKRGNRLEYKGVVYRSSLEVEVAKQLHSTGTKFKFESEGLEYTLPSRVYVPDFIIEETGIYIEAKGRLDPDAQRKMIAVKAAHPDKTFVLLFQRDQPIRKGAKMMYSDWANKHGFDWSIQEIKTKWLKKS